MFLYATCCNATFTSQDKRALEFMKKVAYYSTDEQSLRKVLMAENAIDWSTYFVIGGEFRSVQTVLYFSTGNIGDLYGPISNSCHFVTLQFRGKY